MASGLLRGSVLVLHGSGVTLRGVGKKEIETFGPLTFGQYEERIRRWADEVNLDVTLVQSNWEGALIDALVDHFAQAKSQYVIVNPAGFTWGYPALAKALAAVEERMPAIEVHMTNVCKRPTPSEIGPSVRQVILGFGIDGYRLALQAIARSLGSIPTE